MGEREGWDGMFSPLCLRCANIYTYVESYEDVTYLFFTIISSQGFS